ncbi:MAG: two-component system nitrogen regulation sensor histidine kinase GlnL [Moritella sp.]|jgi:two-component system nitrogen regulation sensor histidine kinase GlnL
MIMISETQQSLLNNLVSSVFVLDNDLHIKYLNPAGEQLLGASASRILNLKITDVIEYTTLDLSLLSSTIKTGQGFTDNEVSIVIDDRQLLVEISATLTNFSQDPCILIEARQIDLQKKISQELYQHVQQQAAQELVRGLAHEIKNPLGGLRGAAQLLEKELDSAELKEFTGIIIEQADRLRALVDRLLGPQKPGKQTILNIHSVIEKVKQLVELDLAPGITIHRDYDPSIPDFEMESDLLQQALLNIISNAIQVLNGHGNIRIITRTAHQVNIQGQKYRLCAEIKIVDDGPGIPAHIKDTLFYPMVTARQGGTGLGLSIAQNLIKQHKGKIECNSWPGHTEFAIYLPLRK